MSAEAPAPGSDRPEENVTLTLFRPGEKAKGWRLTTTWASFFTQLAAKKTSKTTEKIMLPGWSPGTFQGDRRRSSATEVLYAVVLDYDDGAVTMAQALALWPGTYTFSYASWSHSPATPRFRLVLVLSRPVTAVEYAALWAHVADKVRAAGQVIDEACKDPARLWFLYAPRTEHHTAMLQAGEPLDVDAILAARKEPAAEAPSTANSGEHPFENVKGLDTHDVMRAYGLYDGKDARCPACGHTEDNSFSPGGGFKCFRDKCGAPFFTNLGIAARVTLGTTDLDGKTAAAKSNRRRAYLDLRTKFPALPELYPSREERAERAREKLAGMDREDIDEGTDAPGPRRRAATSSEPTVKPESGDTAAVTQGEGTGPKRPKVKAGSTTTRLQPDLARIRARLALLLDLPVDEREVELDKILGIYRTTKTVLKATLRELERERRRGQTRNTGKPQIVVSTDLAAMHDAAIVALAADRDLYRRGSDPRERLARVLNGQIDLLPLECLPERLTTAADWFDEDGPTVPTERTAKAIFARGSYPSMRTLRGVVRRPTLIQDGRVLTTPGYDAGSCLIYQPDGTWPELPPMPAGESALKALAMRAKADLEEVVEDFPFVEPGKTVWLAEVLTVESRYYVDGPLPQFVHTANVPGAGKGALVKAAGILTTGEDPEARALPIGQNAEEELEKRLTGIAIAGTALVFFDEVALIDSKNLQRVATSRTYAGRVLGVTGDYKGRFDGVVVYAGNNVEVAGDLGRRVIPCRLESPYEEPGKRPVETFRHPERAGEGGTLLQWCGREHRRLHMSALTMLRAFIVAKPTVKVGAFGSFEEWAALVAACLVWVGEPDVTATVGMIEDDPERRAIGAVMAAWGRALGSARVWAADVIAYLGTNVIPAGVVADPEPDEVGVGAHAEKDPRMGLAAALRIVCRTRDDLYPTTQALGGWLSRVRNRPVGGRRFVSVYDDHRKQHAWRLEAIAASGVHSAGSSAPGAGICDGDTRANESRSEAPAGIAGTCGYRSDTLRVESEERPDNGSDREHRHARERVLKGEGIPAVPAMPAAPESSGAPIVDRVEPDTRSALGTGPSSVTANSSTTPAAPTQGTGQRTVRARITSASLRPWPPRRDYEWPSDPVPERLVVILQTADGANAYHVVYGDPIWPDRILDALRPFGWHGERSADGAVLLSAADLVVTVEQQFQLGLGFVPTVTAVSVVQPEPPSGTSSAPTWGWVEHHRSGCDEWVEPEIEEVA